MKFASQVFNLVFLFDSCVFEDGVTFVLFEFTLLSQVFIHVVMMFVNAWSLLMMFSGCWIALNKTLSSANMASW